VINLAHLLNRRPVKPGRVAILRADRLGDLVLTTPLVRALAAANWQVTVIGRRDFLPVLENNPHVAVALALEDLCPRWPQGWSALARHLRHARYDAILIPQAAPPPLVWASAFSGAPYRLVLYGGHWASVTLHERVPAPLAEGSGHYARQVLSLGGLLGASTDDSRPEIFLRENELAQMRQSLREHFGESFRPLVILHAGGGHLRATQRNQARNLPVAEYARLTGLLLDATDCRVVITGGPDEAAMLEPLWNPWRQHPRCWFAVGMLALRPLSALLHLADLTIVGSTGPLHLASAVGATTLTLFSPATGVNATAWGNQGGVGHVIEWPPPGRASSTGNSPATINAGHFFTRALEILRGIQARVDSPPS